LNRLAFIKTDPASLTGAKLPQGRHEPFDGEFKALLADRTVLEALKDDSDNRGQNAEFNAKSVTLPERLAQQFAANETFENAKVPVPLKKMDTDDPAKEAARRIKTVPSPMCVCQLSQIVRVEPEISPLPEAKQEAGRAFQSAGNLADLDFNKSQAVPVNSESEVAPSHIPAAAGHMYPSPSDEPPALSNSEKCGTVEQCQPPSDLFAFPAVAEQADMAPASIVTATIDYKVSDNLLNNDSGNLGSNTSSVSSRTAIDSDDTAHEKLNVQMDAGRSEIKEMRSTDSAAGALITVPPYADMNPPIMPSQEIEIDMNSGGLAELGELVVLQDSVLLPEPAGKSWVKYSAEVLPPDTEALPIPHTMHGRPAMVARIISQTRSEPEVGWMLERNLSEPEQILTSSTRPFVGETDRQSTEPVARIGPTKKIVEPGVSISAMQPREYMMPMRAELNVAPPMTSNFGTLLAGIKQMVTELAAPQTYQTEAEEMRAEIHGRMKSIRIMLRPEKLGEVSVNVRGLQEKLRIEVKVLNDDAGRALLPEIDAITNALSGLGMRVDQLTLTAPSGGITVVHSPEARSGDAASHGQNSRFQERAAGENGSRHPGQHRNGPEDKTFLQSRDIYI
jgi:hypothetical protein